MNRVRAAFDRAAADKRAALVVYLTHGDPNVALSSTLVTAVAEAGADVVELGVPFSDPNADGVVIQQAMTRALASGATLSSALASVAAVRDSGSEVPIVLFGYYNPLFVMGVEPFAREAAKVGVDAVLTVDLPIDEASELHRPLEAHGVGLVPLCAPTSPLPRLEKLAALNPPFVYYISVTGVTGAALSEQEDIASRVATVKRASGAPVAVGFGIKSGADAARIAQHADGVVVGSAVVSRVGSGCSEDIANVCALVRELRESL